MGKIYSEEFKKDIINQCLAGTSIAVISKKYGIARSTLYIWLSEKRGFLKCAIKSQVQVPKVQEKVQW